MDLDNPYLKLYLKTIPEIKQTNLTQYLLQYAINFGQLHNTLGFIMTDIIKFIGSLPLDQYQNVAPSDNSSNSRHQNKNSKENLKDKFHKAQKVSKISKKPNDKSIEKQIQYIPEKMQIQNPSNSNPFKNSNNLDLSDFSYNRDQTQPKINILSKEKFSFLDGFFSTEKKPEKVRAQKQPLPQNQSDTESKRTQSIQKPRSCKADIDETFLEIQELVNNKDEVSQSDSNISRSNSKFQPYKKSIFFDLVDSSQSPSQELEEKGYEQPNRDHKSKERNFQKTLNEVSTGNSYQRNTQNTNSSQSQLGKHLKPKPLVTAKPLIPTKSSNLLEPPNWIKSPQSSIFNVQEVDQLQSSHKKPPQKSTAQTQPTPQQPHQYIPRRQEQGRKKIDRQALKGSQCPDCDAFYKQINKDNNFLYLCECSSRHKSSTTYMNKHKVENFSQDFKLN